MRGEVNEFIGMHRSISRRVGGGGGLGSGGPIGAGLPGAGRAGAAVRGSYLWCGSLGSSCDCCHVVAVLRGHGVAVSGAGIETGSPTRCGVLRSGRASGRSGRNGSAWECFYLFRGEDFLQFGGLFEAGAVRVSGFDAVRAVSILAAEISKGFGAKVVAGAAGKDRI